MTNDYLEQLRLLGNQTTIILESKGEASGVAGIGDIGLAAHALATELAAHTDDTDACIQAIIRSQEQDPEAHEVVLYGAILNLVARNLNNAYRLLDGTSTDQRARAIKEWKAIEAGSND